MEILEWTTQPEVTPVALNALFNLVEPVSPASSHVPNKLCFVTAVSLDRTFSDFISVLISRSWKVSAMLVLMNVLFRPMSAFTQSYVDKNISPLTTIHI